MRTPVTYADPEALVVPWLTTALTDEDCTVGVEVPPNFAGPVPHVQVAWDGTALISNAMAFCTVRVTVWGAKDQGMSAPKQLALLAQGLLLAHAGEFTTKSLTGPQPARDPSSHAETVSFTIRCALRANPIT